MGGGDGGRRRESKKGRKRRKKPWAWSMSGRRTYPRFPTMLRSSSRVNSASATEESAEDVVVGLLGRGEPNVVCKEGVESEHHHRAREHLGVDEVEEHLLPGRIAAFLLVVIVLERRRVVVVLVRSGDHARAGLLAGLLVVGLDHLFDR